MVEIKELFLAAMRTLLANKTRSFLTMLGVIIGVASVITLVSIGSGLKSYIADQFESLGSNLIYVVAGDLSSSGAGIGREMMSSVYSSKLEEKHVEVIGNLSLPIIGVSGYFELPMEAKYEENDFFTTGMAVDASYGDVGKIDIEEGKFFSAIAEERNKKVVVIGAKLKEELFSLRPALGKEIMLGDYKFKVVGILKEQGGTGGLSSMGVDNVAMIPLQTGRNVYNRENLQNILVKVEGEENIPMVKERIEKKLLDYLEEDEFSVVDQKQMLDKIGSILGVLTLALGGIAAISLLVGGIGIMNIMLVSVTERTHEIGLRKAVGAQPRDILIQFLIEAVVLSFLGGLIGVIMGFGGSLILNSFLETSVTWWSVLLAFGVSVLVGVVFGVIPASRAAKLNPIEALRRE